MSILASQQMSLEHVTRWARPFVDSSGPAPHRKPRGVFPALSSPLRRCLDVRLLTSTPCRSRRGASSGTTRDCCPLNGRFFCCPIYLSSGPTFYHLPSSNSIGGHYLGCRRHNPIVARLRYCPVPCLPQGMETQPQGMETQPQGMETRPQGARRAPWAWHERRSGWRKLTLW